MRFAIDSNILVYAFIHDDDERHRIAADLTIRASLTDAILPAQVLGEFMAVIRRKFSVYVQEAVDQIAKWAETFVIVETTDAGVVAGARFALRHKLQVWDSIIWQASAAAGAEYIFSEDMQDGLAIGGVTIIDPFNPANAALLDVLLTPMDEIKRL